MYLRANKPGTRNEELETRFGGVMRKLIATWLILLMVLPALAEDVAPAQNETRLPVRKVVLYKNGVGYFEHSGRIAGDQELGIHFTTAQLNDVLKSLTVVD